MHQKALVLRSRLGSLALIKLPIPNPDKDEVLVKIHSSALNPVDWNIQKKGLFIDYFPAVLGCDISGEIVKVGNQVTSYTVGDRVFFQGSFWNSYAGFQQYALVDTNTLAKIPAGMSHDQAATIPLACTTAYLGLYNATPYGLGLVSPAHARSHHESTPFLVIGGSSSVGQFAIQLAKASGFAPIITTSSPIHEEHLLSLGATHVLDRHLPVDTLKEEIQKITASPIPFVFDAISAKNTQHVGMSLLSPGGNLVVVREPIFQDGFNEKAISTVLALKHAPQNVPLLRSLWADMSSLLEDGTIKPIKVEVVPGGLDGVRGGLERLEEQKVSGVKLVVHPQETLLPYN